jgi:methionine-rich copper-binding protein CopC
MRLFKLRGQLVAAFLLVLLASSIQSPIAQAHTKLVSGSPAAGVVVDLWPTKVVLEFDEQLQNIGDEKANFVVINNAVGDQVSETDEVIEGNTISVTLSPNEIKGPVLVFYHVVSTDGHPVEGEYKFTFGEGEVTAEGVTDTEEVKLPIGIYLASGLFITTGLFFAIYSYRRRNMN